MRSPNRPVDGSRGPKVGTVSRRKFLAGIAAATTFAITPEAVAAGEAIYTQNCVPCHGAELEGGIGAPLNDDEWIHGSEPETVIRIIADGVVDKGMLAWGPILGPEKINQVAAYVLSKNAEYVGE